MYNITGQLIQKETAVMGDVNMDVSNLSNGIYILKMQSGKNIRTEKIQIIR
ncbi:MAG: T9SS type A sorting domain-containing protein [Bacteroidales bacterium]|nr:T9SS type A sorting domain-containing protein [Bacteroidales bacterium]